MLQFFTHMFYIDRAVVAKILKTKPVNVRRTQRMHHSGRDIILVALWSQKERLIIDINQYQEAANEFYRAGNLDSNGIQEIKFSTVLIVGGILLGLYGLGMNTSVETKYGTSVSNLSLMQQQNVLVFSGGTMLILGVLLSKKGDKS
jgi:hypothetical protein